MYKNALLLLLLAVCGSLCLQAQEQLTSSIFFASDSDQLDPDAQGQLDQLLRQIAHIDRWQLDIQAHTDAQGTNAYNDALAQRRAEVVRNYLLAANLPLEKVQISTFGEKRPAESNVSETGRSRNRRVEITLQSWPLNNLQDLMAGLDENATQKFNFQGNEAVSLTGANGTTIWIPSEVFIFPDGSPALGTIELEMREAYTYADMIAQGLSTHSGQEILETGGMVYLQARSEGQDLQIKAGGELLVAMPTEQQKPDMQLFTGNMDIAGNPDDWTPTGQPFATSKMAVLRIAPPPAMPKVRTELTFFSYNESGEPIAPNSPREPVYPKEPKRESVKYQPGFFKQLVLGKKKIQEREEAIYLQKVAQYQARLEKYPELMQAYALEMEAHELEMQDYQEAKAAWQDGLQEQWKEHQVARREKYKEAYVEAEEKYRRTLEAYNAYKARKIAAYEATVEQGSIDQSSLNKYFFAVNQLGWINCDRFYNLADTAKEPLMVQDNDEQEEMIFVLFTDIRSALRTSRQDNFYTTQSVPKGAVAKVIGLKVENGRSLLAVKEITVGTTDGIVLDYQPRRLREIRETLAMLD